MTTTPTAVVPAPVPVSATDVAAILDRLRERTPLVHCMTNIVVAGFTANVLLAVGASPAMVENVDESADFAAVADALLINLGTLSQERVTAMRAAAAAASGAGTPWVLDPVAVGALAPRTRLAGDLLTHQPTVVRGNPSEVLSLAGIAGAAGRGVDSA
ncbi:MAG: hydroxyethylthiazole kinase, partial [Actinomycetota bacterium]|nr:hydroxyethylthiazole kinase [Actinomycetota bacterium]